VLDLSPLGAATLYRILGASKIWANLNAVSKSKAPVLGPSKVIAALRNAGRRCLHGHRTQGWPIRDQARSL